MEQQARVRKLNADGTALVVHVRQSACSGDCHQCGGCGAVQEAVTLVANNPDNAQPGELVLVRSASGPVLLAALVMYLLPVIGFFAGYWAGSLLWNAGALTGCLVFALCIIGAVVFDRCTAEKRESGYTIVRYPQNINKGDN